MVKPKCIAETKEGKPCKNPRLAGSMYCSIHEPSHLDDTPKDVKWSILLEVAPKDLPNFCATNREFANMCRDPKFRETYKARWQYPKPLSFTFPVDLSAVATTRAERRLSIEATDLSRPLLSSSWLYSGRYPRPY